MDGDICLSGRVLSAGPRVQAMKRRSALAAVTPAGCSRPAGWLARSAPAGRRLHRQHLLGPARYLITLKGDAGNGAAHVPLPVAPPPCLWQPMRHRDRQHLDHPAVRRHRAGRAVRRLPVRAAGEDTAQGQAGRAGHLVGAAGRSGGVEGGAAAGPHAAAVLLHQARPDPAYTRPLQTLADYAYDHMAIPAPTLTVNPAGSLRQPGHLRVGPHPAGQRDHGPPRRLRGHRDAGR